MSRINRKNPFIPPPVPIPILWVCRQNGQSWFGRFSLANRPQRGRAVRVFTLVPCIVGLSRPLPPSAHGDDPNPAVSIVERAIKGHGGVENLVKTHLMVRRATGTMSFFGQEIPFSDELSLQLPDKSRLVVEGGPQGQKTKFT